MPRQYTMYSDVDFETIKVWSLHCIVFEEYFLQHKTGVKKNKHDSRIFDNSNMSSGRIMARQELK